MTDRPRGVQLLLAQYDTSAQMLTERLSGLTDDEYLWEPTADAWSVRPVDLARGTRPLGIGPNRLDWGAGEGVDGGPAQAVPPARTIAWLAGHLGAGLMIRHEWTLGGHELDDADLEFPVTAAAGLAFLDDGIARWRSVLTDVPGDEVEQVGRSQYPHGLDPELPLAEIMWWVNRELIHHGAEMMVLRDLYAWRQ
jgi:hypothetical protein